MRYLTLIFFIGITILGCKTKTNSCGQAYFGGEIINPNSDHLVLYDSYDHVVDTIYLDENNRFSYNISALSSGLHSFHHGGELQIVVLEANDSVLIRLNTIDFDESLVFTGRGAKKNNYLISLFNTLEAENTDMYKLSKYEPEAYKAHLDSLKAERYAYLDEFNKRFPTSPMFQKLVTTSLDYNYYAYLELYPIRHFDMDSLKDFDKKLPEDFYDYRKNINYDDEDFLVNHHYYNFFYPHINNLALKAYFDETGNDHFDRNSLVYHLKKLTLIDSLVGNKTLKNYMLRYVTRNYLAFSNSEADNEAIFNSYLEKNTNEDYESYMTTLYESVTKLQPGHKFPEIEIVDYKGDIYNVNSIIKRPTVIYFWSSANSKHFVESHNKVRELKEKYPALDFISININSNNPSMWKNILNKNKFPKDNEYRFMHPDAARKILALNNIYKVMVVDNREILATTRMYSKEFHEILDDITNDIQ